MEKGIQTAHQALGVNGSVVQSSSPVPTFGLVCSWTIHWGSPPYLVPARELLVGS